MRWERVRVVLAAGLAVGFWGLGSVRGDDGPDVKSIVMEGRAAGTDANAMEQAKQDALRRAVEQACGTFITGQTKVSNYQAVYDKAMSLAVGYVTEFNVKSTRVADGVSYCTVFAKVSTAAFEAEWAHLLHTLEAEGNPRCVVVVVEDNDKDDLVRPKTNGVVQGIVENFFLNKGVQLMDKGASEEMRERDIALAAMNDDVKKLAAMAAAVKADVLIKGTAEAARAGSSEMGGRTLYKWTATINLRAYHADSAQMLMSNSYSLTKATVNAEAAGDEALRGCADENVAKMLSDIGEAWRKRQNVRRSVQVILENCSRADFKAFEGAVKTLDGVQEVRMRELVNDICQAEVEWSYDVERLVTRIEGLKVDGVKYEVKEQTHDRVTLRVVKGSVKGGGGKVQSPKVESPNGWSGMLGNL